MRQARRVWRVARLNKKFLALISFKMGPEILIVKFPIFLFG